MVTTRRTLSISKVGLLFSKSEKNLVPTPQSNAASACFNPNAFRRCLMSCDNVGSVSISYIYTAYIPERENARLCFIDIVNNITVREYFHVTLLDLDRRFPNGNDMLQKPHVMYCGFYNI